MRVLFCSSVWHEGQHCSLYFYACAMELQKKKSKNLNLCHNFWTIRYIHFISGMHNETMKSLQVASRSMTLWPLNCISKTFNLYHNFWTNRGVAFIYFMCILCDDAYPFISQNFDLHVVTLTLSFDLHI